MRPRTNTIGAITRLRSKTGFEIRKYFENNSFIEINTPLIVSSDCEGAGELFQVKSTTDKEKENFFNAETYLTVSGQLHLEIFATSHSRVYTFGPTFRADKSQSRNHLSEFWMLEPEMAFYDINDTINLVTDLLTNVTSNIMQNSYEDLKFFNERHDNQLLDRLKSFSDPNFFKLISYSDAIDALDKRSKKFEFPVKWGLDLQREHERWISEEYFNGSPVFITNYPKSIKPFYMKLSQENSQTVNCFDLIFPTIGEVVGGSEREDDLSVLKDRMINDFHMNLDNYSWYLDLRKYGSVPHSGFGLGFERYIQFLSATPNIKDVVPLPRYFGNCHF